MKRSNIVMFLAVASVVALTGCHADITYKIDVHPNNTATVAMREVLDDQLYNIVVNQSQSSDPFNAAAARQNGWTVA